MNPSFGSDELEREANPESSAEEFVRREAGQAASGEEEAHDRADGSDSETDSEGADHPLTMQREFTAADMEEGFAEREEEERAEQNGCGGLINAPDGGHAEAHHERGDSNDEGA